MAEPKDKFHYGGQAIIEGVMMRGPKDFAIAVRKADGEIVTTKEDVDSILGKFKWLNKPFLRGTLAMIDSMALGMKALMYSANIAMDEVTTAESKPIIVASEPVIEPQNVPAEPEKKPSSINDMAISAMMVLGLVLGLAVFFLVPIFATKTVSKIPAAQVAVQKGSVTKDAKDLGAVISAVNPTEKMKAKSFATQILRGDFSRIDRQNAAISVTMANSLGAKIGSQINIAPQKGASQSFKVAAIYNTDAKKTNENIVYVGLKPLFTAWQLSILEGLVKILFFVGYILLISRMKDIQRVFQYHGAEHKTINAYEAGVELTVENVQKYNKVHVRCGTSFLLVVLVSSILVMMLITDHLPMGSLDKGNILSLSSFVRWLYKLALLPFIAGIAYEVIRFAGRYKDSLATKLLTFPGLLMQGITTREPDAGMIEVAIKSLECVLEKESERREAEAFESA